MTDKLLQAHLGPNPPLYYSAADVQQLMSRFSVDSLHLLRAMACVARPLAQPHISEFSVGAAVLGESGCIYLGANIEFPDTYISQTIHAEQCAVANAWNHKEPRITLLASTATPCGHCRQFCNELSESATLQVTVGDLPPIPLHQLLPSPFGPSSLNVAGISSTTMDTSIVLATAGSADELTAAAVETARRAHCPYSSSPAAVALRLRDGSIHTGALLENCAYNPTLPPIQRALASVLGTHKPWSEIVGAVFVEVERPKLSYFAQGSDLLKHIAPDATLVCHKIAQRH